MLAQHGNVHQTLVSVSAHAPVAYEGVVDVLICAARRDGRASAPNDTKVSSIRSSDRSHAARLVPCVPGEQHEATRTIDSPGYLPKRNHRCCRDDGSRTLINLRTPRGTRRARGDRHRRIVGSSGRRRRQRHRHPAIPSQRAEGDLADLRRRLAATRWPDKETVADESQGAQLAKVQELVRYWGT